MQEFAQIARAKASRRVSRSARCGRAGSNGSGAKNGNGQLTLPKPAEMAQYCHDRLNQLKDDRQREFVSDMCVTAQRRYLSPKQLAYLVSIYIQIGGRT